MYVDNEIVKTYRNLKGDYKMEHKRNILFKLNQTFKYKYF